MWIGAAWWMGATIPLHAHMGAGGLFVLLLLGLAVLAWLVGERAAALIGLAFGLILPVVGMSQLSAVDSRPILQVIHVLVALGAMGWADRLSATIRRAIS